jgi:hypothetical protein
MSIDYNNINKLIELLYEMVYNNNEDTFEKYIYKAFDPSNIKINDLIKNNFDYKIILNSSFNSKDNFKLIDNTSNKIILKKYFKNFPVTIMIQKYDKKYSNTLEIIDILYELYINQLISELVIINKIPFYLLNICNFNVNFYELVSYPDFYKIISNKFMLYDEQDINNTKLCFSIYEHYSSYQTLKSLLDEDLDNEDLYNIFFQLLFSHAYINYKFGNFKHNDFTIESFLVNKLSKPINNLLLEINKHKFNIKNVKFLCKLFNYRKSKINNLHINSNPSYDIYCLLKSIYEYTKNKNNFEKIKIIINNFFPIDLIKNNLIDENKFQTFYNSINLIPIQILLKNNFFSISINMKSTNISDTESEVKIGYRKLSNNQNGGASKKASKKSSKKASKKLSKKASKKSSKRSKKLSRSKDLETEESEELDDSEDDSEEDSEEDSEDSEENKVKKSKKTKTKDFELTSDQENEDEDLLSDGDDDNFNPIDLEEEGLSKKQKKMMKRLLLENKKLKNKISSKSSKSSKKNKKEDDSTEIDFSDSEKGNSTQNNIMQQPMMQQPMMQQPMMPQNMMQQNMIQPNMMQQPIMNHSMGAFNSSPYVSFEGGMTKLKNGKNKNFSSVLKNVNTDDLIPIIPEMQQLFTAENISKENPQEFSSDVNFGNEPKIMDRGLINNTNIPSFISGNNNQNPLPTNITNSALSSLNSMRGGNMSQKKSHKHFFLTKN